MKNILIKISILLLFAGCKNAKWEKIKGVGIPHEPMSIGNVIYFENINNGIIGGYKLIENPDSKNVDKLDMIPKAYITRTGGKVWKEISFNDSLKGQLNGFYLSNDTIMCKIDSLVIISKNYGKTWSVIPFDEYHIKKLIFQNNATPKIDYSIYYKNIEYRIKGEYKYKNTIVVVCFSNEELLTDFYFISKNKGKNWEFLQEDYGDSRAIFLYKDEYLFAYHHYFGLERLKLK
jgi:hypothetical protein